MSNGKNTIWNLYNSHSKVKNEKLLNELKMILHEIAINCSTDSYGLIKAYDNLKKIIKEINDGTVEVLNKIKNK